MKLTLCLSFIFEILEQNFSWPKNALTFWQDQDLVLVLVLMDMAYLLRHMSCKSDS